METTNKIDAYSTREALIFLANEPYNKISYDLTRMLINRWSSRLDLELLIDLLKSEKSRERIMGAYYLGELSRTFGKLKIPVTLLADDAISHCRQAFVAYMIKFEFYDEDISRKLAKCLLDLDLYVRRTTIEWAVRTSSETFEDFSRLVEAGVGRLEPRFRNPLSNEFMNDASLSRGIRGLDIIRRLRAGEDIQKIRTDVPDEDSFLYDMILFSNTHPERARKMREKARASP